MSSVHNTWAGSCCAFIILMLVGGAALAQEVPQYSIPENAAEEFLSAQPVEPVTVSSIGAEPIQLKVGENRARLFKLSQPVRKIVIGNEGIADVHFDADNPSQVFIMPRAIGSTNVFFMDDDGEVIEQLEISVTMNDVPLRDALKKLLPNENVEVMVYRDSVFLSGNVSSSVAANNAYRIASRFIEDVDVNLVNMIGVTGSQQVIIKVRIIEMDRITLKRLSASISSSEYGNSRVFQFATASTITDPFVTGTLTRSLNGLATVSFQALESQALVKTLAEPTLVAQSGETASFLSGGEIPVVTGADENGNLIFEQREFGILLEFRPLVLDKGRISLEIITELSEIDTNATVTVATGVVVNGFKTKRTETAVDLPSGGSLMLSGLLQDNIANTVQGFPFLKDIPILGALFRSTNFQRDETELVITVTAYLAEPVGNNRLLKVPTDGFEPASDIDVYLLGRLHREYGVGERPFWTDPVEGPFGYLMK